LVPWYLLDTDCGLTHTSKIMVAVSDYIETSWYLDISWILTVVS
jgi:hypothetical protein